MQGRAAAVRRADEEAVVTRLLAFLDIDETSCSECTRQQFRASLARLSASYQDDDAFDKAVKGCWKLEAATKPHVAPPRKPRPPPPSVLPHCARSTPTSRSRSRCSRGGTRDTG